VTTSRIEVAGPPVAWELPGGALAFLGKRLYTVPQVHYRDETDICGLVARGGLMITDNPIKVFAGTQSALSTESR
jgi:hypothetical protein